MADREKVLTWLKICGEDSDCSGCCPYLTENNYANPMKYSNPLKCMEALMRDALELLREQPEIVRCKDCKWYDEQISMCDNCRLPREQTFFCADGERR